MNFEFMTIDTPLPPCMPLPDTSKLEKLNRELEKSEKKLRKAINDEKALQHQLKQLTRKERTHRLCTRGGMLESFLQEPERLTDDDVMLLQRAVQLHSSERV